MAITGIERYYLKLKALNYLYVKGCTQVETARLLNISRVTLGKLLDEARAEGMLKIEIVDVRNVSALLETEEALKSRFSLKEVQLIDGADLGYEQLVDRIAEKSAAFFEQHIRSDMRIGVTWGRTLNAMVGHLSVNRAVTGLTISTLVGSTSGNVDFQPTVLAQNLLNKYSGTVRTITAPFLCHSETLCQDIKGEPQIRSILSGVRELDLVMVGIGEKPVSGSGKLSDYPFDANAIDDLVRHGAVGDICGNFFDIHGELCRTTLSDRIVSIDVHDLQKHGMVVGIGGGAQKVQSILGALNGSYLDVLVTDLQTAQAVLASA